MIYLVSIGILLTITLIILAYGRYNYNFKKKRAENMTTITAGEVRELVKTDPKVNRVVNKIETHRSNVAKGEQRKRNKRKKANKAQKQARKKNRR